MVDPHKPPKINYKPIIKPPDPTPEDEVPDVKNELWKEVFSWAKTIIFVVLFAIAFNRFIIVNARVPTGSMENTIQPNDRIVAFRLSYRFRDPQRYDIVVFRGPPGNPTLYVKRIIGLPGDSLIIENGHVYINGSSVPQRHDFVYGNLFGNHGVPNAANDGLVPHVIPEGHFFMMGDNRNNSLDSRQWDEPYIPLDRILGRVVFRYFPGFSNLSSR